MTNLNNKCDAILKDPFFNNSVCGSPAKWKVKLEKEKEYLHYRCGRHTRDLEKISLYNKKKENININVNKNIINKKYEDEHKIDLNELLKYIESGQYKKDIPIEIDNLFKEIDFLNENIEKYIKN